MPLNSEIFELTLNQQFEVEKYGRLIDDISDIKQLREVSKLLLSAYQRQRAATQWVLNEHLKSEFNR